MSKRQFARSEPQPAGRNLHLVPPPEPKRRPKRHRWKIGRIAKAKYPPELLAYEERIVLGAVREMGGRASVERMMGRWPERFREKQLWWALLRLVGQGKLRSHRTGVPVMPRRSLFPDRGPWFKPKAWFERYRVNVWREFWL